MGRYNGFTARDSHYMNQLDLGRTHPREKQQQQQPWQRTAGTKLSENHSLSECSGDSQSSHAGVQSERGDERCQPLIARQRSPSEGPRGGGGDAGGGSQGGEHHSIKATTATAAEHDGQRLYDYHLSKRMSSLQSEGGARSLQNSQCSSVDAGCSTGSGGSSCCATPVDSPLCAESNYTLTPEGSGRGAGVAAAEEKMCGAAGQQARSGTPLDPTLLRKSHTSEPGYGTLREGSGHRGPKIKETTGKTELRLFASAHAPPPSL